MKHYESPEIILSEMPTADILTLSGNKDTDIELDF